MLVVAVTDNYRVQVTCKDVAHRFGDPLFTDRHNFSSISLCLINGVKDLGSNKYVRVKSYFLV